MSTSTDTHKQQQSVPPASSTSTAAAATALRSAIRPSAAPTSPGGGGGGAGPHTPSRTYSSTFSSPGASGFRQDDDVVILELGSRYIRAGFEGEASPQCCVGIGPETGRRIGDYRDWAVVVSPTTTTTTGKSYRIGAIDAWAGQREFWRGELRGFDLGLFEDRVERAVRDVFNRFLLTDAGSQQRVVLVLPSLISHPLLSSLLTLFFTRWNFSTISILPSPTMAAAAAGLRSALVVDIGWEETTVTTIYEYRETTSLRSTRAMKRVVKEMARNLYGRLQDSQEAANDENLEVDFEFAEEMVMRLGWCRSAMFANLPGQEKSSEASPRTAEQTANGEATSMSRSGENQSSEDSANESNTKNDLIEIELPTRSNTTTLKLSRIAFAEPLEDALFASSATQQDFDEEELPLALIIFKVLASLEPDVRGICMSRIVFVGGGSQIPGVPRRALDVVAHMASEHGWSKVRGSVIDKHRERLKEINGNSVVRDANTSNKDRVPDLDPIDERLRRLQLKEGKPPVQGFLRQVESLGCWSGASLITSIKTRGIVEVDRERFLQHGGLAGAHKEAEISVLPQRQSFGPGVRGAGERSSWTLAGWG